MLLLRLPTEPADEVAANAQSYRLLRRHSLSLVVMRVPHAGAAAYYLSGALDQGEIGLSGVAAVHALEHGAAAGLGRHVQGVAYVGGAARLER